MLRKLSLILIILVLISSIMGAPISEVKAGNSSYFMLGTESNSEKLHNSTGAPESEKHKFSNKDNDFLVITGLQNKFFDLVKTKSQEKIVEIFTDDAFVVSQDGIFTPAEEFNNVENFMLIGVKTKIINFTKVSKNVIIFDSMNAILFNNGKPGKNNIDISIFSYVLVKKNNVWKIKHLTHISVLNNLGTKTIPNNDTINN